MCAKSIAFLGIGLMGAPMARNLLSAGHKLTLWNRSPEKAQALQPDGAGIAAMPATAVQGAEIIISMLSDGPTVLSVIETCQAALPGGAIWIDMSSTRPEEARQAAARLAPAGLAYLDAPVSGGTKGAEAASLAIMVGGAAADFARGQKVLEALGRPVHVGPTGAGQLAKLANQGIVATTIGAVAEAMLLLREGGADPAAVRAALKGGFADSTILQQHGARMTAGDFAPGGLTKFQLKDLDNLLAEAGPLDLPLAQAVRNRFARMTDEMAMGEKDHSALFLELLDRNGLAS